MTPERVKRIVDALDRADVATHQAIAELADKLAAAERQRREAILRELDADAAEGSTP